ncbi:MAG: rhomboid family intramembrane serine protease [Bacteroidales bacterium]|nr:rhomboid family intramembrane serine protease [Bacteroidales bacterium]
MSFYYYDNNRGGCLNALPVVTRNLIIINIVMFAATLLGERILNTTVMSWFALYYPDSMMFRPWQLLTYMFMHGGMFHIFFNMYTLMIFGGVVERTLGSRKFLTFYLLCGLAAAGFHLLVMSLTRGWSVPMVGASGAIYGVLIAYAMLFPESRMTLLFPPVTLSAKWMVAIFAGIELLTGVSGSVEGVAHFAHLGGLLGGWLLIFIWRKTGRLFNQQWF